MELRYEFEYNWDIGFWIMIDGWVCPGNIIGSDLEYCQKDMEW